MRVAHRYKNSRIIVLGWHAGVRARAVRSAENLKNFVKFTSNRSTTSVSHVVLMSSVRESPVQI